MKKREIYIDIAKGIGILLVVYGHVLARFQDANFYYSCLVIQNKIIFSFVMPLFFIISAYFQRVRLEKEKFDHIKYLQKISSSLLVPFYTLSFLFLPFSYIIYLTGNQNLGVNFANLKEMLFALFFQQSNTKYLPSGVLWFLFTLFSYHFFSYLWIRIFKFRAIFLVVIGIILKIFYPFFQNTYWLGFNKFCQFFIFYAISYVFAHKVYFTEDIFISWLSLIFSFLIYLILIFEDKNNFLLQYVSFLGTTGILGSFIVIRFSYLFNSKLKTNLIVKILSFFGKNSMAIYVFHAPTFVICKFFILLLNISNILIKIFFIFVPSVILPLVYAKILSFYRPAYKLLLGRNP
ncbi:acyltransferase family protein [Thermosulfurimonas sp. F29]|uniref:acyltransferase family protein n=1 Tax=Thermosulfurimonas sp. F29 TaxID=2867247 RepID=UPI001C83A4C9|nr:acyltransferase family protein [Thermosulfurimonas sp. F29]MBX6422902.1 acyltransferase family protein [Thermosulfurimonas sp. F29]